MFRSKVASSRGKRATGRGGGRTTHKISEPPKPPTRKLFCAYCKRRGNELKTCFRKNKICFKCGKSDKHFASDCPLALASSRPRQPVSNTTQTCKSSTDRLPCSTKVSFDSKKPKLLKMPTGQAQKLAQEFASYPDSVFAICGPLGSSKMWVTMGPEEEQHVSTINFVSETSGKGHAFQLHEGDKELWE